MTNKYLSTDSYKGVRDFYPEDAAIQQYIFNTWAKTAESFGFERYDASILEPSDLYKAKGAENEELVNEQTYTFVDRGEREVTLRPEMTPTVARMVAGKARELAFPLRWYSIPNLFRYERPQRGRLREHWQFNCDIFGSDSAAADVEIIALAYQTLINFGVKPEQFVININSRDIIPELIGTILKNEDYTVSAEELVLYIHLLDRKDKISTEEFNTILKDIFGEARATIIIKDSDIRETLISLPTFGELKLVWDGLIELGITNVVHKSGLARGFDYYTGTIFEIFEVDSEGNSTGRAMLGGGRYDNLTSMFGGEPISGIGFGMGDVTMRDFLETHNLLPDSIKSTGAKVCVIPFSAELNIEAEKVAMAIRASGISVSTDIGTQKVDKKKARAEDKGSKFIIVIGENEIASGNLSIKNLQTGEEKTGQIADLINFIHTK